MPPVAYIQIGYTTESRAKKLQLLGILSGFAAGAWLGAAEAPTKLVSIGISPMVISLIMVIGVFLARWSLPALILGTSSVRADVRRAPHLVIWALLAGCLWAVANTLTIFAIRDIGLSIAFPLWTSNSLLGILWGFLFFSELRQAGWRRLAGVLGGALVMCAGATLLAIASSSGHGPAAHSLHGVWAALGAGILWGTMYIPYRKAYLTGMNPLSFVTFFSFGELGMMTLLSVSSQGLAPLWQDLLSAQRYFLADARRLRVGDWRHLPAICCKVRGHQPRHPALQLQPALGAVVGNFCFWRVARPQFFHLPRSHRGLFPHDAGSRRHRVFFGHWPRADPLERGGHSRERPLWRRGGFRRSTHGRPPAPHRSQTFPRRAGLAVGCPRHQP